MCLLNKKNALFDYVFSKSSPLKMKNEILWVHLLMKWAAPANAIYS